MLPGEWLNGFTINYQSACYYPGNDWLTENDTVV